VTEPYYSDGGVTLYLGRMEDVLPSLAGERIDCCVTDPPYGETSLTWDRWPTGWPSLVAAHTSSMWCFGSARMFDDHGPDLAGGGWRMSHDVIWVKPQASTGMVRDRFLRCHEHIRHYYRGSWSDTHHEPPRVFVGIQARGAASKARQSVGTWSGTLRPSGWTDDGYRMPLSVITTGTLRKRALHPTEKPVGVVDPLIRYACPPGGLVLDPFAGSGSTLVAARESGRRAVGIEAHEPYAEKAARRLAQGDLFGGVA
jgi:site-specific DNA-methyltransferase (adenine-specific)